MDLFTVGTVVLGAASLALSTAKGMKDEKDNKEFMNKKIVESVNEQLSKRQRWRKKS